MKVEFPAKIKEAIGSTGSYRAGGVDIQELLQIRSAPELITDITRTQGLNGIRETEEGGIVIGATTPIQQMVVALEDRYPALCDTGRAVATPQLRNVATVGGNLIQATRCWYFRNPLSECYKTGAQCCPAKTGNNLYGVIFDQGPCLFPHPSSLAMALLTYDAEVEIDAKQKMHVRDLLGDGSDPKRDNMLKPGQLLTAIHLPAPWNAERGGYFRAISRYAAEWPLVESACRVEITDGIISRVAVAAGGIANTPLRLTEVEQILLGKKPDHHLAKLAAEQAVKLAQPFPQTRYKVPLLVATVRDALQLAFTPSVLDTTDS